jgi:hypothetical protein
VTSRSTPHGDHLTDVGPASANGYCPPGLMALRNGTEAVKGKRRAKAVSRLAPTTKPTPTGRESYPQGPNCLREAKVVEFVAQSVLLE